MIRELTISGLKNIKYEKNGIEAINFIDWFEFDWKV